MIQHFLRVDALLLLALGRLVALDAHIHYWLAWMWHRICAELNMMILNNLVPEEVAECVVLVEEAVRGVVLVAFGALYLNLWLACHVVLALVQHFSINLNLIRIIATELHVFLIFTSIFKNK